MIRLHLLGAIRLEADGAPPRRSVLAQPRRTALLAYLALRARRGPERRDTLLAVFWPESDTNHARGALRNALHFLRVSLGPDAIRSHGSEEVQLDEQIVWCDAAEFERLCDAGEWEQALRLYEGGLLEGFHISEAPAFEQWLESERSRLRQRAADAARTLAAEAASGGEPQLAVVWLRRVLHLAPTDEAAARRLMEVLASTGGRGEALRVFEELQTRLRSEFGLEPDTGTEDLALSLRGAAPEVAPAAGSVTAGAAGARSPDVPVPPAPVAAPAPQQPAAVLQTVSATERRSARFRELAAPGAVAVLLLITLGVVLLASGSEEAMSSDVVAVLPFEYRGSPDHAYLAEGLAELLAANLHGAGDLRAADPRALEERTRRLPRPVPAAQAQRAAAAHGAGLFVVGTVAEAGGNLRITAALHDGSGGSGAQSTRAVVEGAAADMLQLVDRLSAVLLQRRGASSLSASALRSTTSLEALKAYLRAEAALSRMNVQEAVEQLREATQLDTTFALAHYLLSSTAYKFGLSELAAPAAAAALRHAGALARADSFLVAGWYHHNHGSIEQAHALYHGALVNRERHIEAAFQLGELRYHWGAVLGVPASEAREPFSRVLAAEPDNAEAALHLARLAARDGRLAEYDSLLAHLRHIDAGGWWQRELEVTRAFLGADEAAQRRATRAADGHVDWILENAAASTGNLAAVEDALQPRLRLERDAGGLPRAHLFLTHVRLGRGRFAEAARGVEAALMLPEARRLEYRAMMATLPFRTMAPHELRAIRSELAAYPETRLRPAEAARYEGGIEYPPVMWPGMWRPRRLYLLGALHIRLGDLGAAQAVVDSLAAQAASEPFAAAYERITRAALYRVEGRAADALRVLGSPQPPPLRTYESFVDHGRVFERWLRAELLRDAGREAEALRWYATFPDPMARDLAYLGPSYLRRAEIFDAAGEREQAVWHYRRLLELWSAADRELEPELARVRERLRGLGAS